MKVKLFEIRDRGTFVPVICTKLSIDWDDVDFDKAIKEDYLLKRAGYGNNPENYVLMAGLEQGQSTYDPHSWGNRTRYYAHQYIITNWDDLHSGDVIDVEFILGETKEIKISERLQVTNYEK